MSEEVGQEVEMVDGDALQPSKWALRRRMVDGEIDSLMGGRVDSLRVGDAQVWRVERQRGGERVCRVPVVDYASIAVQWTAQASSAAVVAES